MGIYDELNPTQELLGRTMKSVRVESAASVPSWLTPIKPVQPDLMVFERDDGRRFIFYHDQQCCEGVWIESVVGDLSDLEGEPLLRVDVEKSFDNTGGNFSKTWTFYKFATRKGYVDVRWCGESNGYYSEEVDFREEA